MNFICSTKRLSALDIAKKFADNDFVGVSHYNEPLYIIIPYPSTMKELVQIFDKLREALFNGNS